MYISIEQLQSASAMRTVMFQLEMNIFEDHLDYLIEGKIWVLPLPQQNVLHNH